MNFELGNNEILLSVIVPIYNVEKYLQICIDSILAQTFTDYELILVDDGSTDNCGVICEEYAKNYYNVKVIHQKNGGLVKARKTGVENAAGEYIGFVDGDDWIAPDFYEKLINNARALNEGSDCLPEVICGGFISAFDDKQTVSYDGFAEKNYIGKDLEELKKQFLFTGMGNYICIHPAIWAKLIRRDLLVHAQSYISDDIRMGEDVIATAICINNASSVTIIKKDAGYYYRQNNLSMSHTPDWSYFDRINCLFECMERAIPELAISDEMTERYSCYKIYMFRGGIYRLLNGKVGFLKLYSEAKKAYRNPCIHDATNIFPFDSFMTKDRVELKLLKKSKMLLYTITVKLRSIIRMSRNR